MLSGWAKRFQVHSSGVWWEMKYPRSSPPSVLSTENWLEKTCCILWCGNFTWEETVYVTIAAAIRATSVIPRSLQVPESWLRLLPCNLLVWLSWSWNVGGEWIWQIGRLWAYCQWNPPTNPWQYFDTNYAICGWSFTHVCGKSTQLCYFKRDRSLHRLDERVQRENRSV